MSEPRIFVVSDWHFFHNKPFIVEARGFSSITEHNEAVIANHNSVVSPNDIVYHCGDAMMGGDYEAGLSCISRLNGQIRMIRGNHDTDQKVAKYLTLPNVVQAGLFADMFKKGKFSFYVSHYPTQIGDVILSKNGLWNLAGHTHSKDKFENGMAKCYNVSLDAHNCFPVLLDDIIADIREYKTKMVNEYNEAQREAEKKN
jgi:calcineurin-like phosphoesterase family protein